VSTTEKLQSIIIIIKLIHYFVKKIVLAIYGGAGGWEGGEGMAVIFLRQGLNRLLSVKTR